MTLEFLREFEPAPEPLIDRLRQHVTDKMLLQVAAVDYGMDCEQHLAALKGMRDNHSFPAPLPWHPAEVMSLGLHSNQFPNYTKNKKPMTTAQSHMAYTFLAACWLRSLGTGNNAQDIEEYRIYPSLIDILEGPIIRSNNMVPEAANLLSWTLANITTPREDTVFIAIALLCLACQPAEKGKLNTDPDTIAELLNWIRESEESTSEDHYAFGNAPYHRHDQNYIQQQFGQELQALQLKGLPEKTADGVRDLGRLIERAVQL